MKTDQVLRHFLKVEGSYTTFVDQDDVDQLMKSVERSDWGDANIVMFKKTVKRYFKWLKHERGTDHTDWDCPIRSPKKNGHNGTTAAVTSSTNSIMRLSPTDR